MAKLVCQTGPKAGHEYPLSKDVTVMGRQSSCDVQILDNMSSRAHCQIRRDGKLYRLVDLGSRNGTHLNDKKVSERQLVFGDRIRIGEAEYKFVKEAGDVELKDLLSKYEVQEKIGEGGMGIVYKANQKSMNRIVALKILSPKYSSKARYVDQFIKEARAAGALNHQNIIQVHDVGTENDIHYFSMEFIDGATCMQVLRDQGPFKVGEALEIIRQTAKALEYAHSHRLIHQDIKPDNIMLGQNNQVKLADLGISKTFDEVASEEGPKRVMGTPHYMAPEAALGKQIDHRVDIYALGATLYHLLTGKTPFNGTSATEVLKSHVMDPLPPIEDLNPNVPPDVCALVERLVAKKADDRYQTAAEIVEEVVRLQEGHGLGTARIGGGETMLLRRYVGGDAGAPGGEERSPKSTPGSTTNTNTPQAASMFTTAERVIGHGAASGMIRGVVISLVILVGIVIAWNVLNSKSSVERATTAPSTSGAATIPEPPEITPIKPPEATNAKRQEQQIALLEEESRSPSVNLSHLLTKIDGLREQPLTAENLTRAKLLHDRVGALIKQRQAKAAEDDFTALTAEVEKLIDAHNYDSALARITAFPAKDHPAISDEVLSLRRDVTKTRDSYVASLKTKILSATNSRNLTKLKELRDTLPEALLGSDSENDINQAIQTLEDQRASQQAAIVQSAANALGKWDFAAVQEIVRSNRTALGDTAKGKQLEALGEAAIKLKAMVVAINTQLQKDGQRRLRGTLKPWVDPDLLPGDATSLQVKIATGGTALMKWSEIPAEALQQIVKLVLPKDQADTFLPAIDTWNAAKSGADANK